MKKLAKKIKYTQFYHTQIARDGNIAVYRKETLVGGDCGYEVIKIRSHNGMSINNNYYPPAEIYPGSGQWGIMGWTCSTKDKALSKMGELIAREKAPQKRGRPRKNVTS
jgi:hypothetical protein